ncbi:hypothetical protein [Kingella kingae]|uniref:hypothetical protein n=1 Tax=Kingella kingae TaxID=504 RepID=UPI000419CD60|nr:hypothetical protein [Kingella kingae]MDK4607921.1 hypothetical protein [Kingella kingae]MDK4625974.1 hypothetical protein [Kingella kingae]MDK4673678.1 hypothetical protein [Kingella kingae]
MMKSFVYLSAGCFLLAACSPSETTSPESNHSSSPAASQSAVAEQLLNVVSRENILQTSQQAMQNASASDVANEWTVTMLTSAPESLPLPAPQSASSTSHLPPLNAVCEQYYQRADACFAKQGDDANELRLQNQTAREDALRQQPDEAACTALNRSFDAVAQNLGCE